MNFINKTRKIKFYIKEVAKYSNIILLSFGIIISIVLIKYKPMYEVKISGEEIGYIQSKQALNETIENNIENYTNRNIAHVELKEEPEYELKLVERTTETKESDIVIALQKQIEITYKYYEIVLDGKVIEIVDTLDTAEQIANEIKVLSDEKIVLAVKENTTTKIEEINLNTLEVAKENVIKELRLNQTEIANVEGIKIATLPVTGTISSRYGARSSIRSSSHTGLDIAAKKGTPIKVVADGIVTFAASSGSYGYLVKVDHGNGVETWYAHTSKMYVAPGQEVKAGDVIALVGSTGNSTGPHLHFEIRINGEHVNPQKYLYN